MNDTELAYYAGFFDGEGSICIRHVKGQKPYRLIVSLANTYLPAIESLQLAFGGSVFNYNGANRTAKQWNIEGPKAIDFLHTIIPYLKVKKMQAELAIQYQQHKRPTAWQDIDYMLREDNFHQLMSSLNRGG